MAIKKVLTTVLCDRSGSMGGVLSHAQTGLDTFIADRKESGAGEYDEYLQIFHFDEHYEVGLPKLPVNLVPAPGEDNYFEIEPRGMTALMDAIGKTINHLSGSDEDKDPECQLFVIIITDGLENASKEFKRDKIKELVEKKQKDGWIFIFLGANQDAVTVGASYGFAPTTSASVAVASSPVSMITTSGMMTRGLSSGLYAYNKTERTSMSSGASPTLTWLGDTKDEDTSNPYSWTVTNTGGKWTAAI